MILTLIIIGLFLLGLWLYFEYIYDDSDINAMSKSDIYAFQWMPKLFTQPHLLPSELNASALREKPKRIAKSERVGGTSHSGKKPNNQSEAVRTQDLEKEVNELRSRSKKVDELESELSTLKRQADRVTHVEAALDDRERVRREQERNIQQYQTKIKRLEESVRKAESSNNAEATNNLEYRRLQSELIGVNQQRDKYVEQIRLLESQLRNKSQKSNSTSTRTFEQNITSEKFKPKRQPLFTAPAEKDDLKKVKGIGPVMEKTLNELGVTSFKQLGGFDQDDIQRVSDALDVFPGRIERDEWVSQAKEKHQEKYGLTLN